MGGCNPSCSENHPCGVLGCPSSPFIDPPPAVIEPETGYLRQSGMEETSPLITAADESHPLGHPPSAPVLPDEATTPTQQPPPPPPPTRMAAPMAYQAPAIPPRQFVGESSAPPPPPPPQGLGNNEVPIQRVESMDYPPPGHRPFGGEDVGRRAMRRPFPGPHGRWYEYIPVISDLARAKCRQYYPNDHYLNSRPWFRRVETWQGRDSDNCAPPRARRARDRVPSYCPNNVEDSNYGPPLRRWNSYPAREAPPPSSARQNHDQDQDQDPQGGGEGGGGHSDGRQPASGDGIVVQDNIVIGDPTKVRIGEGNRGGRSTRGRITGNVIIR